MDLDHLLSVVLPPECIAELWRSLSADSKKALRASCRSMRDLIDRELLSTVSLTISKAKEMRLSHVAQLLQRLNGRPLGLQLHLPSALGSDLTNELLCQLLGYDKLLKSVQHLTLKHDKEEHSYHTSRMPLNSDLLTMIPDSLPSLTHLDLDSLSLPWSSCQDLVLGFTDLRCLRLDVELTNHYGYTRVLALLPQLTKLDVMGLTTTDFSWRLDLACWVDLEHLATLKFDTRSLPNISNVSVLRGLTALTQLVVRCTSEDSVELVSQLEGLPMLRKLKLVSEQQLDGALMGGLTKLRSLSTIHITSSADLPDLPPAAISSGSDTMPALQKLCLAADTPLETLHWWLAATPNLQQLVLRAGDNPVTIHLPRPSSLDVEPIPEAANMLRQVAGRLAKLPQATFQVALGFVDFDNLEEYASWSEYMQFFISALAPLAGCPLMNHLSLHRAVVDKAVVAALTSTLPKLACLSLDECEVVDPDVCLPLLVQHPGLRMGQVCIIDCYEDELGEIAASVVALAVLAPDLTINVKAKWWDKRLEKILAGVPRIIKAQQQRQQQQQP